MIGRTKILCVCWFASSTIYQKCLLCCGRYWYRRIATRRWMVVFLLIKCVLIILTSGSSSCICQTCFQLPLYCFVRPACWQSLCFFAAPQFPCCAIYQLKIHTRNLFSHLVTRVPPKLSGPCEHVNPGSTIALSGAHVKGISVVIIIHISAHHNLWIPP